MIRPRRNSNPGPLGQKFNALTTEPKSRLPDAVVRDWIYTQKLCMICFMQIFVTLLVVLSNWFLCHRKLIHKCLQMVLQLQWNRGWKLPGDEILMSTGTSCHFGHLLQVSKKKFFEVWFYIIYIIFFMTLFYVYSPRAGTDSPPSPPPPPGDKVLMSTEMACHFIQVKRKCLWSLILYNFFHDLIHVYSPGSDSPQGTKFWCQQKGLITLPIFCKFQSNLFEVWFYTIFFMI